MKKVIQKLIRESLKPNKVWFHGSSEPINKFSFSKIASDDTKINSYYGYGIYFTDNKNLAKSYGDSLTKVTIDGNSDILENKVTPKQLKKVYNGLINRGVELNDEERKWYQNPTYGEYSVLNDVLEFYDFFLRARFHEYFKNIKEVSEFLLESGIDGMNVINDVGDNILVVFNEKIINVV